MTEPGTRPWRVVTDKGVFFKDFDDEVSAQAAANMANAQAKKLDLKTTYVVFAKNMEP